MSISRKYGGFGLGLNITQELVHAHGGKVHVTSQEGQGSSFTFTLPARAELITPHLDARCAARCLLCLDVDRLMVSALKFRCSSLYLSVRARRWCRGRPCFHVDRPMLCALQSAHIPLYLSISAPR